MLAVVGHGPGSNRLGGRRLGRRVLRVVHLGLGRIHR